MQLTAEESTLLGELLKGEKTISGNKRRDGLNRLVEAGYVTKRAISMDSVLYTITPFGRQVVAASECAR